MLDMGRGWGAWKVRELREICWRRDGPLSVRVRGEAEIQGQKRKYCVTHERRARSGRKARKANSVWSLEWYSSTKFTGDELS